jgi:hypothetical protein
MNANRSTGTAVVLARLASVRAISSQGRLIIVRWASGSRAGRTEVVDLSPLVDIDKSYAPLSSDAVLFASIHLIDGGAAIAWGYEEIDMPADAIRHLAERADRRRALRAHQK